MKDLVHEIHVSEIRQFKKCRFAHKLKFIDQLYPKIVAKPLEFGTAYHAAMEVYYNPETWSYPNDVKKDLAIAAFANTCLVQFEALENPTQEQRDDYDERMVLGIGMLNYYFGDVAPQKDINLKPIFVEKSFSIPIKNPETGETLMCKCKKCWTKFEATLNVPNVEYNIDINSWLGLPVHLEGKIDLILQDELSKRYFLLDWKTAARLTDSHEWLELDEQIINYLIAMDELELPIAGFIYHEQLKSFPKPPTINKTRRLGRWFSVDKNQDTSYDLYLETVINGDTEGYEDGNYDEFLQFLEASGKDFYHREVIRRNPEHLLISKVDLYETAREMTNDRALLFASPSKYNCLYCEFMQVCIGRVTGADYMHTIETQFEVKAPYYDTNAVDTT